MTTMNNDTYTLRTQEQIHAEHASRSAAWEQRLRKVRRAYAEVFTGTQGELLLEDLRRWARLDGSSFSAESHAKMAYEEGRRDIVRYILGEIKWAKEN